MQEDLAPVIEALVELLTEKGVLSATEITERTARKQISRRLSVHAPKLEDSPSGMNLTKELEKVEKSLVEAALAQAHGMKSEAARLLGIDRNQMNYLCRKYKL